MHNRTPKHTNSSHWKTLLQIKSLGSAPTQRFRWQYQQTQQSRNKYFFLHKNCQSTFTGIVTQVQAYLLLNSEDHLDSAFTEMTTDIPMFQRKLSLTAARTRNRNKSLNKLDWKLNQVFLDFHYHHEAPHGFKAFQGHRKRYDYDASSLSPYSTRFAQKFIKGTNSTPFLRSHSHKTLILWSKITWWR